jgi:hypothetical protein
MKINRNLIWCLLTWILFAILIYTAKAHAADLSFEVAKPLTSNADYDPQIRIKGMLLFENDLYLHASAESGYLSAMSQPLARGNVYGFGVGYAADLTERFKLFADVGYYIPSYTREKSMEEAVQLRINHGLSSVSPQHDYEFEINPDFGVSLGIKGSWDITRRLKFNAGIEGRWCSLSTDFGAHDGVNPVIFHDRMDMSGFLVTIGFTF